MIQRRLHSAFYTGLRCSSTATTPTTNAPPRFLNIAEHHELLERIPLEDVRTFSFIAHIDHGKSSLSSRVLELAGNQGLDSQKFAWNAAMNDTNADQGIKDQVSTTLDETPKENIELMDRLTVEKERGITVKASTASMLYQHPSAVGPEGLLLINMIDTPGHVDFGREVTRSLSFVQGAVLLLDASQGIQAQTWSVYEKVMALPDPPTLLIALTKVDLPSARPIDVSLSVSEFFDWEDPDDIILTSARSRIGVKTVLDAVCERVPPPKALADDSNDASSILRAQVVDSWYDDRGVNCLVQIHAGQVLENDRISIVVAKSDGGGQQSYSVQEVGIVLPHLHRTRKLTRGQLGYVRFGLRDPRQAMPGTVLVPPTQLKNNDLCLPKIPDISLTKSALYASVHPYESDGFEELCNAVDRLALNDTGLEVQRTSAVGNSTGGPFLGPGLRVGFQGLLHVEVFRQRLEDEFEIQAVVTPPKVCLTLYNQSSETHAHIAKVSYKVTSLPSKKNNHEEAETKLIEDLKDWVRLFLVLLADLTVSWVKPEAGTKYQVEEPIVDARIIARVEDAGAVMELVNRKRGTDLNTKPIDESKWMFTAKLPWGEVVTDFHDQLKNVTKGYGSMDTSEADPPFAKANLSKVDIMLNGELVEPLAFVCHKDVAHGEGKNVCKKVCDCRLFALLLLIRS